MRVDCAVSIKAALGEGPFWSVREACLYWIDMYLPAVYRYRPRDGENVKLPLPQVSQISSPVARRDGGFVLGLPDGLAFYDPDTGAIAPFCHPHGGTDGVFYNDAKADRSGRLWVDTYHVSETEPASALYRIEANGEATTVVDGLIVANGPAFAPDGRTLYLADSGIGAIYAYDVDMESGELGPRRLFAEVPSDSGSPDGMTVDRDGGLWNAHYGGGCITRYTPDGKIDLTVPIPAPNVTSCMFGGPDLTTLYVTTARADLSVADLEASPLSGGLFAVETGFTGLPEPEFAG